MRKKERTEELPPFACQHSPDVVFLLSIAGIFNGKDGDASEHVHEIVSAFIAEQQNKERKRVKLSEVADRTCIDPRKLTHYALDQDSPHGKHKAVLFEKLLGFTRENFISLLLQLEEKALLSEITLHSEDRFGVRYTADIPIQGTEGRHAVVRTGWIVPPASKEAHLATLYVRK